MWLLGPTNGRAAIVGLGLLPTFPNDLTGCCHYSKDRPSNWMPLLKRLQLRPAQLEREFDPLGPILEFQTIIVDWIQMWNVAIVAPYPLVFFVVWWFGALPLRHPPPPKNY